MSNYEVGQPSATYQIAFPAMTAGSASLPKTTAGIVNFFPNSSKVLGLVRTTSGGTPGNVRLVITASAIADNANVLTINSSTNLDTSTYTLYWTNETANSSLGILLPC